MEEFTTMSKPTEVLAIEPRVSILEKGQEALQNDMKELVHSVKEQGKQLETAILELNKSHVNNFNVLSDKITNVSKTDWQTITAFMGVGCIIITAIFSPVWMAFNYVDKNQNNTEKIITKISEDVVQIRIENAILKSQTQSNGKN